jgi:capsular polysaccharide biosynthesis protein
MNSKNMLNLAKNKVKTLILWGLLLAALSFLFLVVTQKNFKSTTDLLIVQNQNGFTDYYALSKSADFLTGILAESIYSEKFLDEVNKAGASTTGLLSNNKSDRLKDWEKIVKITRASNIGTIHIEVFGDTQKQTNDISNAIVTVLTTKNFLFLGSGQDLDVRILNTPTWEKNPSMTNIGISVAGGFIIGVLLAFAFVYYREEKNYQKYASLIGIGDEHVESLNSLR